MPLTQGIVAHQVTCGYNRRMEPTFITGNAGKAAELERLLGRPINHRKIDLPEVQSLSLDEVVEHKARAAYEIVGAPVLVEDVSLVFHALGRLPGPLVKWFDQELGNDGMAQLVHRHDDHTATAEVLYGLCDGSQVHTFRSRVHGSIAPKPRGTHGFGWNPIFIPEGDTQTWAEAPTHSRAALRDEAVAELKTFLKAQQ